MLTLLAVNPIKVAQMADVLCANAALASLKTAYLRGTDLEAVGDLVERSNPFRS